MRVLTVQVAIIFLVAASACASEDADVNALVSQSLHTYNQFEKIRGRMKAATSDLDERLRPIRAQIRWFKKPVPDDEGIHDININITFCKYQISTHEAYIEAARITDPKERARLVDKYEADRERILEEELNAGKPFRKRIDKLKQEFKDKQKPFDKAMKTYCLSPGSKYPTVASTYVSTPFHTGVLRYRWLDSDNKQLALARISLKDKPTVKDDAEMLDNKFYVSTFYVSEHLPNIEVWAGYFHVNFNITKAEWWRKEKIAELIKDFIDLDGLAKIDPTRNDSSLNALAMASLACSKRCYRISRERRDTTGWLTAERVKVKNLKSRFKKPPADSEQLNKDRQSIDQYKKDLKVLQNRLKVGMVTNPNERAARIVKLEAEKKKLDAERRKMAGPYEDKIRKLTDGHKIKDSLLNDAMKLYFLKGENGYENISEITTKAIFYKGTINCNWRDADGKLLCSVLLEVRNRPAIPKDARMLDGLYYISSSALHLNVIEVWVGNFHIIFSVQKQEWLRKEKVAEVLKHFVDLPGLTKIN